MNVRFVSCIKLVMRNITCLRYDPSYNQLEREAPAHLLLLSLAWFEKCRSILPQEKPMHTTASLTCPNHGHPVSRRMFTSPTVWDNDRSHPLWQAGKVLALQHNKMAESSWWRVDTRRTGTLQCRWFSHTSTKRSRQEPFHVSRLTSINMIVGQAQLAASNGKEKQQ